jgi:hypothetical protein
MPCRQPDTPKKGADDNDEKPDDIPGGMCHDYRAVDIDNDYGSLCMVAARILGRISWIESIGQAGFRPVRYG